MTTAISALAGWLGRIWPPSRRSRSSSHHEPAQRFSRPDDAPRELRRDALDAGPAGASTETTSEWQIPDPAATVPDALFDRQWATALVDRAVAALAAESQAAGHGDQFAALKPWLLGHLADRSQAEAAQELGMSEGALKVAIHRLRKRFSELVKAEIAQTVDDPTQVREELRYLVDVLAHSSPTPG